MTMSFMPVAEQVSSQTKIYKRKVVVVSFWLVPLIGTVGLLVTDELAGGVAYAFLALIFTGLWQLFRGIEGYAFTPEGKLTATLGKYKGIEISPTEVTSFVYKKVTTYRSMARFYTETRVFVIKNTKQTPIINTRITIAISGWGDNRKEFFTKLKEWLGQSGVNIDDKTRDILETLVR